MRTLPLLVALFLLTGCLADGPPTLRARNETREVAASANFPGLSARGTLDVDGDRLTIVAFARNDGNQTYKVESGCNTPWSVELFRGDERLELQEPQERCLAFSLAEVGPGTNLTFSTSWSGRIWDPELERQVNARPGDYVWSVRFVAYHPDGAQLKRFDLDFPVTVA